MQRLDPMCKTRNAFKEVKRPSQFWKETRIQADYRERHILDSIVTNKL